MTTLTIRQNIKLPKTHFKTFEELRSFVAADPYENAEIRPEKLKQWAKARADIAKGKGVSFTSAKAALEYLRKL